MGVESESSDDYKRRIDLSTRFVHSNTGALVEPFRDILRQYWGYNAFRQLQTEAMRAVLDGRDSFIVLPTGGSCY